jgi:enterobacterial common antigen flippase
MAPSPSAVRAAVSVDEVPSPAPPTAAASGRHTYRQILHSTALIGGSAVVTTATGIFRAKAFALLLGPAGMGLMGLYSSIADLTQSIAELGVNSSGVRQMAEAAGSGDTSRIAKTAAVLRRTSVVLGLIGGFVLIAFCRPIAAWTFGSTKFALPVACLSIAVFFRLVGDGHTALIQGMRRIPDLARIGMLSTFAGTIGAVTLAYFFGTAGVMPSLVLTAAVTLALALWYSRKIEIPPTTVTRAELRTEVSALLKLGTAFMLMSAIGTATAYVIRIMVRERLGFEAAGLYQSAWTLGGLYVAFILQSMGSDFYPRLTAVANDHPECNRLVNEQAHVSLLLAGPGVIGTVTFAPLVLAIFYNRAFAGAVYPLRWICLGMALRIIAWPMGFIIVAKGDRALLVFTEVAAALVHLGLGFTLIRYFGLSGAAMGFFGLYVWHGLLVYVIVRKLSGFRWAAETGRTALLYLLLIGLVFSGFLVLPGAVATSIGTVALLIASAYSWSMVRGLVSTDGIPRKWKWLRG